MAPQEKKKKSKKNKDEPKQIANEEKRRKLGEDEDANSSKGDLYTAFYIEPETSRKKKGIGIDVY